MDPHKHITHWRTPYPATFKLEAYQIDTCSDKIIHFKYFNSTDNTNNYTHDDQANWHNFMYNLVASLCFDGPTCGPGTETCWTNLNNTT